MSFNKKFLSKSPLEYHGGPHGGDVKANTKAFTTMSDILPKKNITPPRKLSLIHISEPTRPY